METSDPLARAQDVKRCQLCPNKSRKTVAETVCNTCHVNLCKDCVGHHMTSNPTIRHDVVTFQFKTLEIMPPQCKLHQTQKCEMFCEKCDSPICLKCLASGSHENHDVSQIYEILRLRKQIIEKDTQELKSKIAPVFESILSEIDDMLSDVFQKHEERQQAITKFGKRCHTLVDSIINRYLSDSKKVAKQDGDSIKSLKAEFEKIQSSIHLTIDENHSILASNIFSKFISYATRNYGFRNIPPRFELTVPPLDLIELTEQALCQFIGVVPTSIKTDIPGQVLEVSHPVYSVNQPTRKLIGKPQAFTAFLAGYKVNNRVCCIPNSDEIYVSGNINIISHMNTEWELLEEIATKSGNFPADLTATRDGHLVYTDLKDRSINRKKNAKIECLIRLRGWIPLGICSTSTDDLLVTMRSNDYTQSKVVRYSGSPVKQDIQYSNTGKPLYSDPGFITENTNLDIVVSDIDTRTVVVVDREGKFRFSYNGQLYLEKSFSPRGVTTDRMCHILIVDRDNHIIHIIDQDGQFLQYINSSNLQPHDLSTNSNDMLIVTEYEAGMVKRIKYLE